MIHNEVVFIQSTDAVTWIPQPEKYEFKQHGPFGPIQKALFRLLCWSGALRPTAYRQVATTRLEVRPDRFINNLMLQQKELFRYGQKPSRLLIGTGDFQELMQTPEFHSYVSFDATYGKEVCGLQVTLVPWMRGIVVLP